MRKTTDSYKAVINPNSSLSSQIPIKNLVRTADEIKTDQVLLRCKLPPLPFYDNECVEMIKDMTSDQEKQLQQSR
jgi:hypothetical protein